MSRGRDLFRKFETEGEAAIDEFIAEKKSEELFLDFKRSADQGAGSKLHRDDRANLARAIAGFGNSDGGIIVWGVECSKDPVLGDIPTRKLRIVNPSRFVSWLENTTSGCTLPPHPRVQHAAIKPSGTEGFVVTYIPQSQLLPHRCIVEKDQYLIRAGSNFIPVPHGVLQGMFGRSPTPILSHAWQDAAGGDSRSSYVEGPVPSVSVFFLIRNDGLCPAEDVYFNVNLVLPGPNCNWRVGHPGADWSIHASVMGYHLMTLSGKKLAPAGVLCPTSIDVDLKPPFDRDLSYEITFGCSGSAVRQVAATRSGSEIEAALSRFLAERDHVSTVGRELAHFVFVLDQPPSYEFEE